MNVWNQGFRPNIWQDQLTKNVLAILKWCLLNRKMHLSRYTYQLPCWEVTVIWYHLSHGPYFRSRDENRTKDDTYLQWTEKIFCIYYANKISHHLPFFFGFGAFSKPFKYFLGIWYSGPMSKDSTTVTWFPWIKTYQKQWNACISAGSQSRCDLNRLATSMSVAVGSQFGYT